MKSAAFVIAFCLASSAFAQRTGGSIWTADSLTKIRPGATPTGSVSVSLSAARNETVSFQIVVAAAGSALPSVDMSMGDPSGPNAASISAADNVVLYKELFYDVQQISDPRGAAGPWPDALVPKVDPYFHETRNAFPIKVAANSLQPVWVDVHVPAAAVPGEYYSIVTVTFGVPGQDPFPVGVTLNVRNFALPSVPSLPSLYGYDEFAAMDAHDPANHFNYDGAAIFTRLTTPYLKMLVRHRIGIDYDSQDGTDSAFDNDPPNTFHWDLFDANVGAALAGSLPDTFGNALAAIDLPDIEGGGFSDDQKKAIWQGWASHFRANGWLPRLYDYPGICDEPDPADSSATAAIRAHATLLHATDSALRLTSTTAIRYATPPDYTTQAASPLLGAIDVWVPNVISLSLKDPVNCAAPGDEVPRADYEAEVAAGRAVWTYQSCNSHGCEDSNACSLDYPSFMIDAPATHNRIMQWMTWFQNATGELYYALNYGDSVRSRGAAGEFTNLYDFGGNGDGTLVYPGTPALIGGTTHIPIESIRLKQIRDGEQDFEYFTLLARGGRKADADAIVGSIVSNDYTFNDSAAALLNARQSAAAEIESLPHGRSTAVARIPVPGSSAPVNGR